MPRHRSSIGPSAPTHPGHASRQTESRPERAGRQLASNPSYMILAVASGLELAAAHPDKDRSREEWNRRPLRCCVRVATASHSCRT
ncbi:hypothetical protein HOE425_332080 [Hoeflea sp. EC-HK425]|nr:hypothetical protein HOE425_332080 [Hoeflea sp. EC-HK425]